MPVSPPDPPGLLTRALVRLARLFASLRTGSHRLLRLAALGAQLALVALLLLHPRLVIPYLPSIIGGCTFCPARAVTSIDYRRSGSAGALVNVPVCSKHVHDAPARFEPRSQALGSFWLLVPLFLFYGFILLLLAFYGVAMLAGLEAPVPSPVAWWPACAVFVIGIMMSGIVVLHARKMFTVTLLGEEFDAARWVFWLALPLAALVVGAMSLGFSGSVAIHPDHGKVNSG